MLKKICRISGKEFEITDDDLKFYEKMGVPTPTLCPEERSLRQMATANQRNLYHRTCSATGKKIISNYSSDKPQVVYDVEYWWSDKWDVRDFGQDFDFNRSFFDQFKELLEKAPLPALHKDFQRDQNADFTNYAGMNRDCYLIFDSDQNQDCYYGYSINKGQSVVDCFRAWGCELSYECIDSHGCYNSRFLQNCENCSDSYFLKNCIGCKDCFGSVNLRNKQYYFLNKPYSKEEYLKKVEALQLSRHTKLKDMRNQFLQHAQSFPHKYMQGVQNEGCVGNYLTNCKNAIHCFDSGDLWDCKYFNQAWGDAKDCMDCTQMGMEVEMNYECCYAGHPAKYNRFCSHGFPNLNNSTYCFMCPNAQYLFGCVGARNSQYCILNKQYSEVEYKVLVEKIIAHMKKTGEWGEFFPAEVSPFAYNETHASEYFPLSREDAEKRGYSWKEEEDKASYSGIKYEIPDDIHDVQDDILEAILICEETGKNYRIIKPELDFYRTMRIPIPRVCPEVRHKNRIQLRNPRKLWDRKCAECGCKIQTTYAPDRPEKVLCEECYLKVVD